jgi:hypothetical protein
LLVWSNNNAHLHMYIYANKYMHHARPRSVHQLHLPPDSTACSTLREYAKKPSVNRRFAESAVALNLSLVSSMLFFPALALQFRTGGARGGSRTSEPEPQGPRMPRGSQESGRCSGALLGPSRRPPTPDFIF